MRPTFQRNGAACYLDRVRGFLVPATPEELVRQDALDWLIDELGAPVELVRSEFSIARRGRSRGRADILLLAPGSSDYDGEVLLVVECKRPEVIIDDATRDQACGYAASVNAPLVALTNGGRPRCYARDGTQWREVAVVPSWQQMLAGKGLRWAPTPVLGRPSWEDIATPEKCFELADKEPLYGAIFGEDTPEDLAPFVFNVFAFLTFAPFRLPAQDDAIVVEQDLGRRSRTFGHHMGGTWHSDAYRSLVVRDRRTGSHQVVSMTVCASAKANNDPRYGNATGRSMLCVAVDQERSSRLSLEMTLDGLSADVQALTVDVRHHGALTRGRQGAVARKTVRNFLARRAPSLLDGEEVHLGTLPTDRLITWRHAREHVVRLVRYAIEREALREELHRTSPPIKTNRLRISAAERYAATLANASLSVGQHIQALWEGDPYSAEVLAPGARRGSSGGVFIDEWSVPPIARGLIRVGWGGEGLYSDVAPGDIVVKRPRAR